MSRARSPNLPRPERNFNGNGVWSHRIVTGAGTVAVSEVGSKRNAGENPGLELAGAGKKKPPGGKARRSEFLAFTGSETLDETYWGQPSKA
jgi:hypothetical protein